jgi:hypothetical protein
MKSPDAGMEGGTKDGSTADATPDATTSDGGLDGGHFVDATTGEGGIADNGSIGGGGCACNAVGHPGHDDDAWPAGAYAALFALAASVASSRKRRRRHEG